MRSSTKSRQFATFIFEHKYFILLLIVFLILAIYYNFSLPIGESDHEASHYRYISYVKKHWAPPPPDLAWPSTSSHTCGGNEKKVQDSSGEWQFTQPPIYYFLSAAFFFWVQNDELWWPEPNPYPTIEGSIPGGGKNVLVHKPDEAIGIHPTVLEVHLIRLFSTILGMIGLLGTYLLGYTLFDGDKKMSTLLSGGVALIPMYITSASVINNDILIGVFGIYSIYFLLKSVKDESRHVLWGLAGIFFFILSIFTKYTFFILLPVLGMTIIFSIIRTLRDRKRGRSIQEWLSIISIELFIFFIGPFVFLTKTGTERLSQRYVFLNLSPTSLLQSSLEYFGNHKLLNDALAFSFHSYWGLLGADTITLPDWMLTIFLVFSLAAAAGVILIFIRSRYNKSIRFAILSSLLILIIDWMLFFILSKYGARGRYLLSLYPLVSLLMIAGLGVFRSSKYGAWLGYLYILTLFTLSALTPVFALRPNFTRPPIQNMDEWTNAALPVHATFGDFAELVSMDVEPKDVAPGDILTVRIMWRVLSETDNNYTVGIHLEDGNHRLITGIAHFPGNGRNATSLWKPGEIINDAYWIKVSSHSDSEFPTGGYIKVTMYCPGLEGDKYLLVTDADGNQTGDAVYSPPVRVGFPVSDPPPTSDSILGNFGGELALMDIQGIPEVILLPTTLTLSTTWQALKRPSLDYTLSVQVINEKKEVVVGQDIPFTHDYYPTSLWLPNEKVQHEHTIQIPILPSQEKYRLIMSIYGSQDKTPLILDVDSPHFTPEGYLLKEWTGLSQWQYHSYFPWVSFESRFGE